VFNAKSGSGRLSQIDAVSAKKFSFNTKDYFPLPRPWCNNGPLLKAKTKDKKWTVFCGGVGYVD
jgi:hypothetical protein